jgi:hypothetical protein
LTDVNAAATSIAQQINGPSLTLPVPNQKQALRIVEAMALFEDVNATHFLTVEGCGIFVSVAGVVVRAWNPQIAHVIAGPTGILQTVADPEVIAGNDYAEMFASLNSVTIQCAADVSNSDAAVHAFHQRLVAIVELYQIDETSGLGGRRRTIFNESQVPSNVPTSLLR